MKAIKHSLIHLAVLFVLIALGTPAHAGLIAYYSFDGEPAAYTVYGATQVDGGYNGTKAYSFNGTSDYIYADININPSVRPQLTMGAWVVATSGTPIRQVISHDDGGYDRSLGIDSRGGGTGWSAFSGNGAVLGSVPVGLDQWTFVAVVYDQAAGSVLLYVDGATRTETGTEYSGWNYIRIGSNPSFGEYFKGVIDDVFIFDTALTPAQLDALRASPHPVPIPGALLLLAPALVGIGALRKRV